MKIYDCFLFNNELDILELHLAEMQDGVDWFVIGEANRTFKGQPKPFHLLENWERFRPYWHKIRRVEIISVADPDPWKNEDLDRDHLRQGLWDADPNDIILCSDCDEIYRCTALASMRGMTNVPYFAPFFFTFIGRLNYIQTFHTTSDNIKMMFLVPSLVCRFRDLQGIAQQRKQRHNFMSLDYAMIMNAGWHFSFMGDDQHITQKIHNFDYTWLSAHVGRDIDINSDVENGTFMGLKDNDLQYAACCIDDFMPRVLNDDTDRWKHLIIDRPNHKTGKEIVDSTTKWIKEYLWKEHTEKMEKSSVPRH